MAKKMKRFLVLAMALILCVVQIAAPALAEDGTVVEINSEGLTVTATTTTTDDGNGVVTVTIEKTTEGTTAEGVQVDGSETTTKTSEGNTTTTEVDGEETRQWTEEDAGDGEQTEVNVELIPGTETESTVGSTAVEGDVPADENDENYDYTETETTDRTVTANTSEVETTVNDVETGLVGNESGSLKGLTPVYDENDDYILRSDGRISDATGKDGLFDRNYLSETQKYTDPSNWDMPEGADFRYVGTGEHSKYFVGFFNVVYQKDEEGNTVYDEEGNPVIEKILNSADGDITIDGEAATELLPAYRYDGYSGSRAQNFMLMDKNGNRVFGYCCDLQTGAVTGEWYSFSNLEDSDYYASEESEEHIRSIAMNGYWGTSDIPDEDGNYAVGSLERIKASLKAAIESGELSSIVQVPVRNVNDNGNVVLDENGEVVTVEMNILDFLDEMTEGEAMLATQAAIWTFANGSTNVANGMDGSIVVSPDWYRNHQLDYSKHEGEPLDDEAGARVEFLYNWLINLEAEEESTIIINEKNFVEDMSLTVGDKAEGYDDNIDDDKTNDVYNTNLNFKLAFIPGENDDLLVQITYTDLDGNPVEVIRRLAGENAEGTDYEDIAADADGNYTITGLKLRENEDFNFDLRLEGTQYLEQGVYVYAPVGGRDVSQTFVGVAEGERNVDVTMGVTVSFDVDEDNHIVATRRWHSKNTQTQVDPINPNNPGGNVEINNEPVPLAAAMMIAGEDELVILDEEVPLAAAPQTGDNSIVYVLMSLISLCGIVLLSKKRSVA